MGYCEVQNQGQTGMGKDQVDLGAGCEGGFGLG